MFGPVSHIAGPKRLNSGKERRYTDREDALRSQRAFVMSAIIHSEHTVGGDQPSTVIADGV